VPHFWAREQFSYMLSLKARASRLNGENPLTRTVSRYSTTQRDVIGDPQSACELR
jgi:hypothetical protein